LETGFVAVFVAMVFFGSAFFVTGFFLVSTIWCSTPIKMICDALPEDDHLWSGKSGIRVSG